MASITTHLPLKTPSRQLLESHKQKDSSLHNSQVRLSSLIAHHKREMIAPSPLKGLPQPRSHVCSLEIRYYARDLPFPQAFTEAIID